jgi:hypothetical protein
MHPNTRPKSYIWKPSGGSKQAQSQQAIARDAEDAGRQLMDVAAPSRPDAADVALIHAGSSRRRRAHETRSRGRRLASSDDQTSSVSTPGASDDTSAARDDFRRRHGEVMKAKRRGCSASPDGCRLVVRSLRIRPSIRRTPWATATA